MREERIIYAHHEAGHVVAAVMRGGTELHSVTLGEIHGWGLTRSRQWWDHGFIVWAGPWAEARYLWGERPLDVEDEDGAMFADHVGGVLMGQSGPGGDLSEYMAAMEARNWMMMASLGPDSVREMEWGSEQHWLLEMEEQWKVVRTIAARLHRGDRITDADVWAP